jgi:hypothetical protein
VDSMCCYDGLNFAIAMTTASEYFRVKCVAIVMSLLKLSLLTKRYMFEAHLRVNFATDVTVTYVNGLKSEDCM